MTARTQPAQNPPLSKSLRLVNKKNVDRDQIIPSPKSGKGGLGWQTPKPTSEGPTPARSTKSPNKMSPKPELSEASKHTEVYPRNTTW